MTWAWARKGLTPLSAGRAAAPAPPSARARSRPRAVRGQQPLDRGAEAVRGDAGRDGDEARARDVGAVEVGDEALAAGARPVESRTRHEDRELVGACAPDHVGRARETAQALGHGEQGGVARGRAATGVEGAEAVDVHQRQRCRLLGARGVGEDRLGVAGEGLERQQPGAAVDAGAVGELRLEAGQPGAGIGQRTAQLMTIAPQQHVRVIGVL
jgi:hypothetical protein